MQAGREEGNDESCVSFHCAELVNMKADVNRQMKSSNPGWQPSYLYPSRMISLWPEPPSIGPPTRFKSEAEYRNFDVMG